MMQLCRFIALLSIIFFHSCASFNPEKAKHELADGFYNFKSPTPKIIFLKFQEDTIEFYQTQKENRRLTIHLDSVKQYFPPEMETQNLPHESKLVKKTVDIDFLTIPFKIRKPEKDVPAQLNANINGAIYLGFRRDRFRLSYQPSPLNTYVRKTRHFSYSFGAFTGMGNTFMSPTNTQNQLQQEYDGIVWSKGTALIIAIHNFTLGVAVGLDHLLDKNRSIWIYQGKPWTGFAFGLNLN